MYDIADPIPLSDRSIPMVELRTVETEYLGFPFTECKDAVFTPVSNLCQKYGTKVIFWKKKIINFVIKKIEIDDPKVVDFEYTFPWSTNYTYYRICCTKKWST